MDSQTAKIQLVKTILEIEDDEFIQKLTSYVKKEKPDFWNDLNTAEQSEIKKGIEQINQGRRVSLESFLKKIP